MRVLVLGATGRLGSMLQWGWQGEARVNPIWHGRAPAKSPNFRSFDILTDRDALHAAIAQCDVVLCLAGITPASGQDLTLNQGIALAVQEAAAGKPLLVASSAAVYGRASGLCREQGNAQPAAPYGVAKLEMERALITAGGPVTCLRIGNVAGADQLLGQVPSDRPLVLDQFPDGRTPRRSYIGPATLARMMADLCVVAGTSPALPPVLNLANPGGVEMGALLDAVPQAWSTRPAPESAIAVVVLDTATLGRFITLDEQAGRANRLVAEWRAYIDQWEQ